MYSTYQADPNAVAMLEMCNHLQNSILSILSSPRELSAEDCRREEMVDADTVFVEFLNLSAHSFKLVISPPSTFIARGSAGLPRTVPLYLESSSAALCFFLRTTIRLEPT
jgi:hypothetical protein